MTAKVLAMHTIALLFSVFPPMTTSYWEGEFPDLKSVARSDFGKTLTLLTWCDMGGSAMKEHLMDYPLSEDGGLVDFYSKARLGNIRVAAFALRLFEHQAHT